MWKIVGGVVLGKISGACFGHVDFEMLNRRSLAITSRELDIWVWSSGERFRL